MTRSFWRAASALGVVLLSACGGDSGTSVTWDPSRITGTFEAGAGVETVTVCATLSARPDQDVWIWLEDSGEIFDLADMSIYQESDRTFSGSFDVFPSVLPGRYQGTLTLHLCTDDQCQGELKLSGATVPYDIEVTEGYFLQPVVDGVPVAGVFAAHQVQPTVEIHAGQTVALVANRAMATWHSGGFGSLYYPTIAGEAFDATNWSATLGATADSYDPMYAPVEWVTAVPVDAPFKDITISFKILPPLTPPPPSTPGCTVNSALIVQGGYAVENNAYSNASLPTPVSTFQQCVAISAGAGSAVNASWTWSWSTSDPNLHAYPEIEYGQKPWMDAPTPGAALPRKLGELASVSAHLDRAEIGISPGFTGYQVIDLYVASDMVKPVGSDHVPVKAFVEVFLKSYGGQHWALPFTRSNVAVGGCHWDTVYEATTNAGWPMIAYFPQSDCALSGILDQDVMPFIADFRANEASGLLTDADYLTSFEFGTQIFQNGGELDLNDFSVTVGP